MTQVIIHPANTDPEILRQLHNKDAEKLFFIRHVPTNRHEIEIVSLSHEGRFVYTPVHRFDDKKKTSDAIWAALQTLNSSIFQGNVQDLFAKHQAVINPVVFQSAYRSSLFSSKNATEEPFELDTYACKPAP